MPRFFFANITENGRGLQHLSVRSYLLGVSECLVIKIEDNLASVKLDSI